MLTPAEGSITELALVLLLGGQRRRRRRFAHSRRRCRSGQDGHTGDRHVDCDVAADVLALSGDAVRWC